MWIPVAKASALGQKPLTVKYWGTPVVLFRTESGQVGALEDACGHRLLPLSEGVVRGESIRCGYHQFAFGADGTCTSTPPSMNVDPALLKNCKVHRLFVREAVGVIWVSVDADAYFPVDAYGSDTANVGIDFNEVGGEPLVWLDHFLDMSHTVFTHATFFYTGNVDALPKTDDGVWVDPAGNYPITAGRYVIEDGTYDSLLLYFRQAGSFVEFFRKLFHSKVDTRGIYCELEMLSPVCQRLVVRYQTRFGDKTLDFLTFVNPQGNNHNIVGQILRVTPRGTRFWHWIEKWNALRVTRAHILVEDAPFLSGAKGTDVRDFFLTPRDAQIVAKRAILSRYIATKKHLYPKSSVLHSLASSPGLTLVV